MTVFWPWGGVWRWRVVEEEEGWEEDFKEGNTHSRLLTTPPSLFLWWYLSSPPPQRIRLTYSSIYKHKQGNKSFTWQLCLFSWSTISHVCSLMKKKKCSPPEWLNANWLMWCYSPCARHWTQRTHKAAQLLHEPVCLRWPMHIKDTFPFSRW